MPKTTDYRKITLRCYDSDLIAWLDNLPTTYGAKSQTINTALKRGAGLTTNDNCGQSEPIFDLEEILPVIRQVVKVAVVSALGRYQLVVEDADANHQEDQGEIEALLARFDDNFDLEINEGG
jgi:hypothetical protein